MVFNGKVLPIVYSYQNGERVWDYVLPDEVVKTKCGFQVKPRRGQMECRYRVQCIESNIRCATCIHNEKRSYYVPYHEYPSDKWPEGAGATRAPNVRV